MIWNKVSQRHQTIKTDTEQAIQVGFDASRNLYMWVVFDRNGIQSIKGESHSMRSGKRDALKAFADSQRSN